MHIQKFLAVICVAALTSASSHLYASDTPSRLSREDEAKLREQLRQTIADLNAKEGVATAATPATPPPPAAPMKPEPALPLMQPVMIQPTPATANASADVLAKAREQMRQTIADLNAKDAATAATAPVAATMENGTATQAPKVKKLPAADASMTESKREMKKVEKSGTPDVVPMAAPMAPGSKEQRLADLLQSYKSDKISPSEYHQQRAKIVSEP